MVISKYKNVLAGFTINIIQSYDFVLYGFYSAVMGPVFFPLPDPQLLETLTLLVFALPFIFKPLGATISGYVGDKYGRKRSLMISIILISVPTLIMGILPGYDRLGIWAPITLVLGYVLQGVGSAASYSSAAVFLNEHSALKTKGLYSGLLVSSSFMGSVVASCMGVLLYKLAMPDLFNWRLVFIIGGLLGLAIIKIQHSLQETPQFHIAQTIEKKEVPLISIFKNHKRSLFCTIGIAMGSTLPYYILVIYLNSFLYVDRKMSHSDMLSYNTWVQIFWMVMLPFVGYYADKIGELRLMKISSLLLMILSVPLTYWYLTDFDLNKFIGARFTLSLISMGIVGPAIAYISRLFPTSDRQTGLGLGYFLGAGIFGGSAPAIASLLTYTFHSSAAFSFYLALSGLVTWIALKVSRPLKN